jgi:excinuclease ABC subunit B
MTPALTYAVEETQRRRALQIAYNADHGITPQTIAKEIRSIADQLRTEHDETVDTLLKVDMELFKTDPHSVLRERRRQMEEAVAILDFETAAIIRDEIKVLEASRTPKRPRQAKKVIDS